MCVFLYEISVEYRVCFQIVWLAVPYDSSVWSFHPCSHPCSFSEQTEPGSLEVFKRRLKQFGLGGGRGKQLKGESFLLPFCSVLTYVCLTFSADRDRKFRVSVNKTHKKDKHFRWDLVDFGGGRFKLGLCTTLLFHT